MQPGLSAKRGLDDQAPAAEKVGIPVHLLEDAGHPLLRRQRCIHPNIRNIRERVRLTVALSQIGELRAQEVVNLSDRRRSIPGALLAGFFRRLWMSLTARVPVDAEYVPIEDTPESAPETLEPDLGNGDAPDFEAFAPPPGALNADLWDDFEFKRLAALYRLLKPSGYALRLAPFPAGEDIHAVEPGFRDAA